MRNTNYPPCLASQSCQTHSGFQELHVDQPSPSKWIDRWTVDILKPDNQPSLHHLHVKLLGPVDCLPEMQQESLVLACRGRERSRMPSGLVMKCFRK